jgi:hypothetical protein
MLAASLLYQFVATPFQTSQFPLSLRCLVHLRVAGGLCRDMGGLQSAHCQRLGTVGNTPCTGAIPGRHLQEYLFVAIFELPGLERALGWQ